MRSQWLRRDSTRNDERDSDPAPIGDVTGRPDGIPVEETSAAIHFLQAHLPCTGELTLIPPLFHGF